MVREMEYQASFNRKFRIIILSDNYLVNKIMDFESITNNIKEETNLPPPSFSRVECPMDYG
jgi:hypothetical protein